MSAISNEQLLSDLVVFVVTYNSEKQILRCLQAARDAGCTHVQVWDNASTDETVAIIKELPGVSVHQSGVNLGFASAVNQLAKTATNWRYALLLNPDCYLREDTVRILMKTMATDERIGVIAPRMRLADGRVGISGGSEPTLLKEMLSYSNLYHVIPDWLQRSGLNILRALGRGKHIGPYLDSVNSETSIRLDWVSGFCALVRRDAWQTTRGLDERFFLYFEDVAFGKTLADSGWKSVLCAETEAIHHESASSTRTGKSRMYYRAMWIYFRNYGTRLQRLVAKMVRA